MGVISIQMNLTTFSSLSLVFFLPPKQSSSCVEQAFFLGFGEFCNVMRSSKTWEAQVDYPSDTKKLTP